jgi:hypothetical protein
MRKNVTTEDIYNCIQRVGILCLGIHRPETSKNLEGIRD